MGESWGCCEFCKGGHFIFCFCLLFFYSLWFRFFFITIPPSTNITPVVTRPPLFTAHISCPVLVSISSCLNYNHPSFVRARYILSIIIVFHNLGLSFCFITAIMTRIYLCYLYILLDHTDFCFFFSWFFTCHR